MKMKLFRSLLTVGVAFSCVGLLAACDAGGGDKEDETPHNLVVKANLAGEEKTDLQGLSGAGMYADQDKVELSAPNVSRYAFRGWYDDKGEKLSVLNDFNWNMYDREGFVEARYDYLKYDITYVGYNNEILTTTTNPASYNGETATSDISLELPPEISGLVPTGWFYVKRDASTGAVEVPCTKLPTLTSELDEVAEGKYALTLFALYEDGPKEKYDVTLTYDETLVDVISILDSNGQAVDITNGVEEGTTLDIWFDISELEIGYFVDGFYVNDEFVSSLNRESITITEKTDIEFKVSLGFQIMIFLQVEDGIDLLQNEKLYRLVEERELPEELRPLTILGIPAGASVNIETAANEAIAVANQIGEQGKTYEINSEKSRLSLTVATDDTNLLFIVYDYVTE